MAWRKVGDIGGTLLRSLHQPERPLVRAVSRDFAPRAATSGNSHFCRCVIPSAQIGLRRRQLAPKPAADRFPEKFSRAKDEPYAVRNKRSSVVTFFRR